MKNKILTGLLIGAALAMTPRVSAGPDPVYTSLRSNTAIGGYDAVSFFSGKPLKGKKTYFLRYEGADWLFHSQANLDLFQVNPDAFMPQYGGYCAYAMAHGKLAKGDARFWNIKDGLLYLNFNRRIQESWLGDIDALTVQANAQWAIMMEEAGMMEEPD